MEHIQLDTTQAVCFLRHEDMMTIGQKAKIAHLSLEHGTCKGNDFLGWLHLPSSLNGSLLDAIKTTAERLREKCDTIVVAGIGGSYLGAKAVIEALSNSFAWLQRDNMPTIIFAGNNIGEDFLAELSDYLSDKRFGIINISKSGTTTETALAFRLLKRQCEQQRGKDEARQEIVAITDAVKGAARKCAETEGYTSFVIPDNVGGRFSVCLSTTTYPNNMPQCANCSISKERK